MNLHKEETSSLSLISNDSSIENLCLMKKPKLTVLISKYKNTLQKSKYDEYINYVCESACQKYVIETQADEGTFIDNFKTIKLIENEQLYLNEESGGRDFLQYNITYNLDKENNYIIHYDHYSLFPVKYISSPNTINLNELKVGTKIRIGQIIYEVHLIKINTYIKTDSFSYVINVNQNEETKCTVCLGNINDDYLISTCKCIGSVKYCHYLCLLNWIKQKCVINLTKINDYEYTMELNKFYCEICKVAYPFGVYVNEEYFLFLIEKLNLFQNCIILSKCKKLWDDNNNNNHNDSDNKIFHIFNFYSNEITLGRSSVCSVKIDDQSISKKHCSITLDKENKKIFIKDLNSKYGTLINNYNYSTDITLNNTDNNIVIQKGNTLYDFKYTYN